MESEQSTGQSVYIGRALQIDGWMAPQELTWLAAQAQVNRRIVELGSFLGRSTRALADNTAGKVLAVDHWRGPNDVEIAGREFLLEQFNDNLKDHIERGTVLPWNINHWEVTAEKITEHLKDEKADMIFIDGDHTYRAVSHDIETWLPFLGPGGLLCGHDYNFNYPGLLKAVVQLVPDPKPAPGTDIWYWQKPEL